MSELMPAGRSVQKSRLADWSPNRLHATIDIDMGIIPEDKIEAVIDAQWAQVRAEILDNYTRFRMRKAEEADAHLRPEAPDRHNQVDVDL